MKERPILFSAPMVRAILAGTKTQTRRIVKPRLAGGRVVSVNPQGMPIESKPGVGSRVLSCPYGLLGQRLWVRETWRERVPDQDGRTLDYRADHTSEDPCDVPWRPSIHMPRTASRIALEITGVRAERLQQISQADALAEGTPGGHGTIPGYTYNASAIEHYRWLWEQINGPGSWDANPWVWVVTFRRV